MIEEFSKEFWEERHAGHEPPGRQQPNPYLMQEVERREPGSALDAGCGQGNDALWLAARGWRVMAVDIAENALRRAQEKADELDEQTRQRVEWVRADLAGWTPPSRRFDLVYSHYVHPLPPLRMLGSLVAPGGVLLIVGHDHDDEHVREFSSSPHVHFGADHASVLDPRLWTTAFETNVRTATTHQGADTQLRDTILRANKRER